MVIYKFCSIIENEGWGDRKQPAVGKKEELIKSVLPSNRYCRGLYLEINFRERIHFLSSTLWRCEPKWLGRELKQNWRWASEKRNVTTNELPCLVDICDVSRPFIWLCCLQCKQSSKQRLERSMVFVTNTYNVGLVSSTQTRYLYRRVQIIPYIPHPSLQI